MPNESLRIQPEPLEDDATHDASVQATTVVVPPSKRVVPMWFWIVMPIIAVLFAGVVIFTLHKRNKPKETDRPAIAVQSVDLNGFASVTPAAEPSNTNRVVINGQIQTNGSIVLEPSKQPSVATLGQLYFDQDNKTVKLYNGRDFQTLLTSSSPQANQQDILETLVSNQLTLPQDLRMTASPSFSGLNIGNSINVSGSVLADGASFSGRVSGLAGEEANDFITKRQLDSVTSGGLVSRLNALSGAVVLQGNAQIGVMMGGQNISLSIQNNTIGDNQLAYNTGQDLTVTSNPRFAALSLQNGSGNQVVLQSSALSDAVTFTLPTTAGAANQCLLTDGTGILSFGGCSMGSGNAFVQGGNAFGSASVLGTTDNQNLNIIANNQTAATFASSGQITMQAGGNMLGGFTVLGNAATSVLTVSTQFGQYGAVGIGTSGPGAKLHVVQQGSNSRPTLWVSNSAATAPIALFSDDSEDVMTINDGGSVLLQNSIDSAEAFSIMDHSGTELLWLDSITGVLNVSGKTNNAALTVGNYYGNAIRGVTALASSYGVLGSGYGYGGGVQGVGFNLPGVNGGSLSAESGLFQTSNTSGTNTAATLVTKANTSQTADLLQAQNASGTVLASISADGTLTVARAIINGNLSMNGHIVSGNTSGTTTIAAGAAACSTPTVTIAGNDTAGTITITSGTGCSSGGILATITFATTYGSAPRIVLTPANSNAATPQYYSGSAGTTNFTLDTNSTLVDATTYKYNYVVIQ